MRKELHCKTQVNRTRNEIRAFPTILIYLMPFGISSYIINLQEHKYMYLLVNLAKKCIATLFFIFQLEKIFCDFSGLDKLFNENN